MGALAISSDGARIVTGSYFRAGGQVWNAETGAYLHLLHVWGLPAAVSADGGRIISVISDSLKVRDAPHCHQHALAFAMALQPRPACAPDRGAICRTVLGEA